MYDIVIVLGVNLTMLSFGAAVNHQYVHDQVEINKIRECLVYVQVNLQKVMDPVYDVGDTEQPKDHQLKRINAPYLRIM
jgi:hypothetical protein